MEDKEALKADKECRRKRKTDEDEIDSDITIENLNLLSDSSDQQIALEDPDEEFVRIFEAGEKRRV
jgi:hypothetical protein